MVERLLIAWSLLAFVTLFVLGVVLVVSPHGATGPGILFGLLSVVMVWACLKLAFGEREHRPRRLPAESTGRSVHPVRHREGTRPRTATKTANRAVATTSELLDAPPGTPRAAPA